MLSLLPAGWGGAVSVWNAADCAKQFAARSHDERCTDVAWHPAARLSQTAESVNLATGGADGTAALMNGSGELQLGCSLTAYLLLPPYICVCAWPVQGKS